MNNQKPKIFRSYAHVDLGRLHCIDVFPDGEYQNGLKNMAQFVKADGYLLRSEPKKLSDTFVNEMLLRYDFYDDNRNAEGKGAKHQYKLYEINGDKVIIDKATGLVWQQSGSTGDMPFEDTATWLKEMNQIGFACFNDWRLPTLEEAMSLVDPKARKNRHINKIFDQAQDRIWTCDSAPYFAGQYWVVYFLSGFCDPSFQSYDYYVRAVRSGEFRQPADI